MANIRVLRWAALALVSGCAGAAASSPPPAAAGSSPPLTAAALNGVWVEYWAPGGSADSERYQFDAAGRFAWDARRTAGGHGPAHKQGAFQLPNPSELVLSVEAEDFAACETCSAEAADHRASGVGRMRAQRRSASQRRALRVPRDRGTRLLAPAAVSCEERLAYNAGRRTWYFKPPPLSSCELSSPRTCDSGSSIERHELDAELESKFAAASIALS
jgi:hypothetical protein